MMDRDLQRFRDIVKGQVKDNLKKYISSEELIGRKGKDLVSIPLPQINLPKFKFSNNGSTGVGQGEGGDKAGDEAKEHQLEVDVSIDELADLMGEALRLPRIEPKGKKMSEESHKYKSLRKTGPESLRNFKQTYKSALKRLIMSDAYDPDNPIIVPIKEDKRYRSSQKVWVPRTQALIIYMMDISGSMGMEEKALARMGSFWIDIWLRKNFNNNVVSRYIVHDSEAREVDQDSFYSLREAGGTKIASAYQLLKSILNQEIPIQDWNVYVYQYSDGEDWSTESSNLAMELLKDMLPWINQWSYCQVKNSAGFIENLNSVFSDDTRVVTARVADREDIYGMINRFFKPGQ